MAKTGAYAKAKGRRRTPPFVMLYNSWLETAAWHALSGNAVKLLLHLVKMSKGDNGASSERGELFLSERDAAAAIGVARNTATTAFRDLVEKGFVASVRQGHFAVKAGEKELRATVWRLTFQPHPQSKRGPTNDFLNWEPKTECRAQKLNGSGSKIDPSSDYQADTGLIIEPDSSLRAETASGPIIEPHIDIPGTGDEFDEEVAEQAWRAIIVRHWNALSEAPRRKRWAAVCDLPYPALRDYVLRGDHIAFPKLVALRSAAKAEVHA